MSIETSSHPADAQLRDLLRRAALFQLLARTFAAPHGQHEEGILAQFERLGDVGDIAGEREWTKDYDTACAAWRTADTTALELDYARLFLRECPCPPNETAYGDGRRMGGRAAELADINGFYQAFGMQVSTTHPDLPDHLATELEFYSLLLLKLAYAKANGRSEQAEITREAAQRFLEDHLGRWPAAFRAVLEAHCAGSPYRETARLVEAVVAQECRRTGAAPTPAEGCTPLPDEASEAALTCPMAERGDGGCVAALQEVKPPGRKP